MRIWTAIGIRTIKSFLSGLIAFCVVTALAAEFGEEVKRSNRAESQAKSRRQAIQKELKGLGTHEWAGEYFEGDGLGENVSLVLAPKSGYVFEWHGCLGMYDRNYGAVSNANGKLRLAFTFENHRKGFQGIADWRLSTLPRWREKSGN